MEFEKLEKQLLATAKAFRTFKTEFGYGKSGEELLKPFFRSLEESLGAVETEFDFLIGKDTVNIDGKSFGACAEAFVKQIKRLNATDLSGYVVNGSMTAFATIFPEKICSLYQSAETGEYAKAKEIQFSMMADLRKANKATFPQGYKRLMENVSGIRFGDNEVEPE